MENESEQKEIEIDINTKSSTLTVVKEHLIALVKSFSFLLDVNNDIFDQLKLQTLKKHKNKIYQELNEAIVSFDNNNTNNTDYTNDGNTLVSQQEQAQEQGQEYLQPQRQPSTSATDSSLDRMSIFSGATGITAITAVSSIAPHYSMNDPLIVIMGIGEYENNVMPSLNGVKMDYENIINTFVNHWKYKVFYQLSNNNCIYSNDINEINNNNNYKLHWNDNEIDLFIEESRKYIVRNKHNGLVFSISSHGDRGRVMYDSNGEPYELDCIYSMFSPQASVLLESYKETPQESNHLFKMPKIFFLDMCRGSTMATVTQVENKKEKAKENEKEKETEKTNKKDPTNKADKTDKPDKKGKDKGTQKDNKNKNEKTISLHETTKKNSQVQNGKMLTQSVTSMIMDDLESEQEKTENEIAMTTNEEKKEENVSKCMTQTSEDRNSKINKTEVKSVLSLKGIHKEDASALVAQMSNFSKLYANVDGFVVADSSASGGIFTRNICKVFKDTKFVRKNKWSDIIIKIREYTKRDATLFGRLLNMTQLVENEGTLEQPVIFASKYLNLMPIINEFDFEFGIGVGDDNDIDDILDDKFEHVEPSEITIANMSEENKIAVLIENEKNLEDREELLQLLTNDKSENRDEIFIKNGYSIIDIEGGSQEFYKIWDNVYITLFIIDNQDDNDLKENNSNQEIYDRRIFSNDYLYWVDNMNQLRYMKSLLPKCNRISNETHKLRYITNNDDNSMNIKCLLCNNLIGFCNYMSYCRTCNYSVCQQCCHSIISENTDFELGEPAEIIGITRALSNVTVDIQVPNQISRILRKYKSNDNDLKLSLIMTSISPDNEKKDENSTYDNEMRIEFNENDIICDKFDTNHIFALNERSNIDIMTESQITNDGSYSCQLIIEDNVSRMRNPSQIKTIKIDDCDEPIQMIKMVIRSSKLLIFYSIAPSLTQSLDLYHNRKYECFVSISIEQNTTNKEEDKEKEKETLKEKRTIIIPVNIDERCLFNSTKEKSVFVNTISNQEILSNFKKNENLLDSVECQLTIKDKTNENEISISSPNKKIGIIFSDEDDIKQEYKCIFTKCNGKGRFGPTSLNDYIGKANEYDTFIDRKSKGIQLWTVPKTGTYKVICYGAKGSDSIYENNRLFGGNGAIVGGTLILYKNDIIKIVIGQTNDGDGDSAGGGGGGGTYFVLYKTGNNNPNYKSNSIVNVALIIGSGGNGACDARSYKINGINGLSDSSENRDNYGGYKSNGYGGRGGSFLNDFNIFKSYDFVADFLLYNNYNDYNKCNPLSFVNGSIGGKGYGGLKCCNGGFGGGGRGFSSSGGGGGGYIGALVSPQDKENLNSNKYRLYGALSFSVCQNNIFKIAVSGKNNDNGKIELEFLDEQDCIL